MTKFFWLKDLNAPAIDKGNMQEYRFCRVPFGVISSTFLLGATIEAHLDTYNHGPITNKLRKDIYVDNLLTGTITVEEAVNLYSNAKGIFKRLKQRRGK